MTRRQLGALQLMEKRTVRLGCQDNHDAAVLPDEFMRSQAG